MKLPNLGRTVLCLLLVVISIGAWSAGTEQDLDAAEEGFIAALLANDRSELEKVLGAEFFYNTATGRSLTKKAFLQYLDAGQLSVQFAARSEVRTTYYEDVAIVSGVYRVEAVLAGKASTSRSRYLHVWYRQNSSWRLVARQVTYLDG